MILLRKPCEKILHLYKTNVWGAKINVILKINTKNQSAVMMIKDNMAIEYWLGKDNLGDKTLIVSDNFDKSGLSDEINNVVVDYDGSVYVHQTLSGATREFWESNNTSLEKLDHTEAIANLTKGFAESTGKNQDENHVPK
jgi:hypothetical protein